MTGAELKQLRIDLGNAVGRRLSTTDLAQICGLFSKDGSQIYSAWENGNGPEGAAAELLSILAYASDNQRFALAPRGLMFLRNDGVEIYMRTDETRPIIREIMRQEILKRLSAASDAQATDEQPSKGVAA